MVRMVCAIRRGDGPEVNNWQLIAYARYLLQAAVHVYITLAHSEHCMWPIYRD